MPGGQETTSPKLEQGNHNFPSNLLGLFRPSSPSSNLLHPSLSPPSSSTYHGRSEDVPWCSRSAAGTCSSPARHQNPCRRRQLGWWSLDTRRHLTWETNPLRSHQRKILLHHILGSCTGSHSLAAALEGGKLVLFYRRSVYC